MENQHITPDTIRRDLNAIRDRLDLIGSQLGIARRRVHIVAKDNRDNPDAFRAIVAGRLAELDPVEREADEQLAALLRSLDTYREWLAGRDWRADVTDDDMNAVNQHVPILKELMRHASASDLATAARDAAEHPDRARAAAWTLLAPTLQSRTFEPRQRAQLDTALRACRARVTDATVAELTDALADVRLAVDHARSDLARRRGDGQTGSLLQRYAFGRPGGVPVPPDPLDVDRVLERVG